MVVTAAVDWLGHRHLLRTWRRRTGIEPARPRCSVSPVLKTGGPTRNPDASLALNLFHGAPVMPIGSGGTPTAAGFLGSLVLGLPLLFRRLELGGGDRLGVRDE